MTQTDTLENLGDAFAISDAGDGTVDLISYELLQLNPMQL